MSDITETTIIYESVTAPEISESKEFKAQKRKQIPIKERNAMHASSLVESEQRISSGEKNRINSSYQLAQSMKKRTREHEDAVEEEIPDAQVDKSSLNRTFKTLIGVDPGSSLRKLEEKITVEEPELSIPAVRAKARIELKKDEREHARLKWQKNQADTEITAMLSRDKSEQAQQLIADYQDQHALLNGANDGEVQMQLSFNKLRRYHKIQQRDAAARLVKQANALLLSKQSATPELATVEDDDGDAMHQDRPIVQVTDRTKLFEAPIVQSESKETRSGLVVHKNTVGEVIEPYLYPVTAFATLFASEKSRSEETMSSDAVEYISRFHATTINTYQKVLDSAPSDACLTASGVRPSGSMAQDLRILLEEAGFDAAQLSNDRIQRYQAAWQRTNTEVPADTESALAVHVNTINRQEACELMRKIGMSESDVQKAMIHGKSVEHDAFMRAVFQSINSDAFIRAEEQIEAETSLQQRVKADLKRASKQTAASTTTGHRGFEALGINLSNAKQTPLQKITVKMLGIKMEEVDRDYLQSYMRPPIYPGERACVRGEMCFCMRMAATFPAASAPDGKGCGFIAKEFLLPTQDSTFKTHGTHPAYRYLCVICDQAIVTAAVYDNVENRKVPQMPLHRYTVKVDVANGYRRDQLLDPIVCGTQLTGIVGPFPAFSANKFVYSKLTMEGRTYNCLIETETDFRSGSASDHRT